MNLPLADSAVRRAGFGETEFYADFVDKAAVVIVRLAPSIDDAEHAMIGQCPVAEP